MKKAILLVIISILILTLSRCGTNILDNTKNKKSELKISLKWFPAYPQENKYKVETGLKWILAYLGADALDENYTSSIKWSNHNVLTLDFNKLEFSNSAKRAWKTIISKLKETSEYRENGWIDIGYFVSMTFNNSWSYYAITDVSQDLETFISKYNFDDQYDVVIHPKESCVASGFRLINIADANEVNEIAYIAKEGQGETLQFFKEEEFEVFDYMHNGQPRFAIYNQNGELTPGGDTTITQAGKPAKCMWCHTTKVQKLLFATTETDNFIKLNDFSTLIQAQNKLLKRHWKSVAQNFVADSMRQHSLAELLYVTYKEPTLYRLRNEGISDSKIDAIKSMTHMNQEYKFYNGLILDSVIDRSKVVPDFDIQTRETHLQEINLLK